MKRIVVLQTENSTSEQRAKYRLRKAARAVVFDDVNKIALLFVSKKNYHKLPGGGIEQGEDAISALKRECLEEIGCKIEVIGDLGSITEYRDKWKIKQESFCYLARVAGEKGRPVFTQAETSKGFVPKWVTLDEAIYILTGNAPADYEGQIIKQRDLAFLKAAREIM